VTKIAMWRVRLAGAGPVKWRLFGGCCLAVVWLVLESEDVSGAQEVLAGDGGALFGVFVL
jgi:hypothetical protein